VDVEIQMNKNNFIIVMGILLLAVTSRLIPHPWGVTAIGGASLFCGFYFKNAWLKYSTPLIAMFISDCVLGFHSTMLFVYSAIAITTFIGSSTTKVKLQGWLFTTILSGFAFFVVTNFGVWVTGSYYTKNISGLFECYLMAIPFLEKQLIGDLIFSGIFFGAYSLLVRFQNVASFVRR
jgi:hypothetical protein